MFQQESMSYFNSSGNTFLGSFSMITYLLIDVLLVISELLKAKPFNSFGYNFITLIKVKITSYSKLL